jgi:hypothetical protein
MEKHKLQFLTVFAFPLKLPDWASGYYIETGAFENLLCFFLRGLDLGCSC